MFIHLRTLADINRPDFTKTPTSLDQTPSSAGSGKRVRKIPTALSVVTLLFFNSSALIMNH